MNIEFFGNEFRQNGWKNMQPGNFSGIQFDLIGYKRVGATKMHVFIKHIHSLDAKIATIWHGNFELLYKNFKPGIFKSEALALCLLADNVEPVGIRILGCNFGDSTRKMIIADTQNHSFYGDLSASIKFPIFNAPKKNLKKLLTESLPKAIWLE